MFVVNKLHMLSETTAGSVADTVAAALLFTAFSGSGGEYETVQTLHLKKGFCGYIKGV